MKEWGIVLLIGGGVGYFWSGSYLSQYETGLGRLAVAFSSDAASQYQLLKMANTFSGIAALVGIVLIVLGFYQASKT